MPVQDDIQVLRENLYSDSAFTVYAVLDGASIPNLPQTLWKHAPHHVCLYRGELEPDLAATAPYLVALEADAPFTDLVLSHGWGAHWGIFAIAPKEVAFRDLRKHFRTFLMVSDPDGKTLYFRYYDPRVLRAYLPTCNSQELKYIFGPVARYCAESKDGDAALMFNLRNSELKMEEVALSPAAATN